MTAKEPHREPPKNRPWRRFFKRCALGLLGLVLLLILFHRPLIFGTAKYFAVRFAKEQKLQLSYEIGGSIFTSLTLKNLQLSALEPGLVEKVQIGTLNLSYSLLGAIRHGLPSLLEAVDVRDVFVVLDPAKAKPPEKPAPPSGETPLIFPNRLNLENINFIARSATGDTSVAGFHFQLAPDVPGILSAKAILIPGVHEWRNLAARTTFDQRRVVLSNLVLDREINVRSLSADLSQLNTKTVTLSFQAILWDSQTNLTLTVKDLTGKNQLSLRADSAGLRLENLATYLSLPTPLAGVIERFALTFDGTPNQPRSWSGSLDAQLDRLVVAQQPLGRLRANGKVAAKSATIALANQLDAKNSVVLNATTNLPENLAGFAKADARGHLEIALDDLSGLARDASEHLSGDVHLRSDFSLENGALTAEASIAAKRLAAAGAELLDLRVTMLAKKQVLASNPFFAGLTTETKGDAAHARVGDTLTDALHVELNSRGAEVNLSTLSLAKATNTLKLRASYTLPADLTAWTSQKLSAEMTLHAPELSAFVAEGATDTLTGALELDAKVVAQNGTYDGSLTLGGRDIDFNGMPLRSLDAELKIANQRAEFSKLSIVLDDRNSAAATGGMALSPPFPYEAKLDAQFPDLSLLQPLLAKLERSEKLSGSLEASFEGKGALLAQPGNPTGAFPQGKLVISGRAIQFGELAASKVDVAGELTGATGNISQLEIVFDANNRIDASARVGLGKPFDYDAAVHAAFSDLSVWQPLLKEAGRPEKIGGSLSVDWRGHGAFVVAEGAKPEHSGEVRLDLLHANFGTQSGIAAHLAGSYSPQKIEVPELTASVPQGQLALSLHHENSILQIDHLALTQGKLSLLEGTLQLPLDLAGAGNADLMFPDEGEVKVALRSTNLELKNLFEQVAALKPSEKPASKQKTARLKPEKKAASSPLVGTVNTTVSAEGTIANLAASVSVRATKLRSESATKLSPADVSLDLNLRDRRLKLEGTVQQREIRPLTLSGDVPLDLAALKKSQKLDPATPLALRISLPRSPLGFVANLVPAIRFIDGNAAFELRAAGTIGVPQLSGSAEADIPNLRLKDTSQPPLNRLSARLDFTRERILLRELKGGIGGGSFGVTGSIALADLSPTFDLRLVSNEALVVQNDNVTARLTADLRLTGPLNAASVTGTAKVTKGRFFKDIDILPIGLPGRPAPQPPPEEAPIGFPNPPLRDWKFDVSVQTSDPFLVQGNLANGRSVVDLKLGGTGARPWLDGSVRIDNLMTSLPFSRLEITSGLIYFTQDKPFSAGLDIRGESTIRDYKISVYIYGNVKAPQALFTSEPPLPQAEIIELIATGATARELAGDSNALAGRAAVLVAQKFYRKLFKKSEPSQPKDTPFKNVQFDFGAPDPRTGSQSVQIRLPLTENVVLSGGLDVEGGYRGQVKYSMKFR